MHNDQCAAGNCLLRLLGLDPTKHQITSVNLKLDFNSYPSVELRRLLTPEEIKLIAELLKNGIEMNAERSL